MNALLALDWRRVIPSECILYTTTEPCPLCVGAVRMTRLREVHYAARDGAAGSADLFAANDFMRRGNVRVHGPFSEELEALLVALLVEFALAQNDDNTVSWVARVGQCAPRGLALGRELAETGALRAWARDQRPAGDMVDALALRLADLTA
jgi:tRNA(adenine34) deaminase